MNVNDLKCRIAIQKLTVTTNENGFSEESWVDITAVWSAVSNLSGREYFQAAAANAEETVKFRIRYLRDLDATVNVEGKDTTKLFRIKFNNSLFNITFIDDVKFEHVSMEVKTLLAVA